MLSEVHRLHFLNGNYRTSQFGREPRLIGSRIIPIVLIAVRALSRIECHVSFPFYRVRLIVLYIDEQRFESFKIFFKIVLCNFLDLNFPIIMI